MPLQNSVPVATEMGVTGELIIKPGVNDVKFCIFTCFTAAPLLFIVLLLRLLAFCWPVQKCNQLAAQNCDFSISQACNGSSSTLHGTRLVGAADEGPDGRKIRPENLVSVGCVLDVFPC